MTTRLCPTADCGSSLVTQERRPNGEGICGRGHRHPAADFRTPTFRENDEYRDRMDGAMELLANKLVEHGVDDNPQPDHAIAELATRKIDMLVEMILATGMHPNLLKAAMKG